MKKLFAVCAGIGGAIIVAPVFFAFEAHVVNVTAAIEHALDVPALSITFGTVFPQEKLDKTFGIALSDSFLEEPIGTQFASGVVASSQGRRKDGTLVLPDRSDPIDALGAPQSAGAAFDGTVVAGSFFSLGFSTTSDVGGGWIILSFDNFIINDPATTSDITVFEVTGGTVYPEEKVTVEASQDGATWFMLGIVSRDNSVDLGVLPWASFVRLTDVSDKSLFEPTADAYDLDALRATSRSHTGMVEYVVRQKPKCVDEFGAHPQVTEDGEGNFVCPEGSVAMPLLCPYLSKHELTGDGEGENDGAGINAFHGLPGPWNVATAVATQVEGMLSSADGDSQDEWNVDLRVPCFEGTCAQDWDEFVRTESGDSNINPDDYKAESALEHAEFGCDLWIEVIGLLGENGN